MGVRETAVSRASGVALAAVLAVLLLGGPDGARAAPVAVPVGPVAVPVGPVAVPVGPGLGASSADAAPAAAPGVALAAIPAAARDAASEGRAQPLTVPPVPGQVVAPFDPPAHPYGPGRRGVRLASAPEAPVRAARAGTVSFAGEVAGAGWVSVDHGGGLVTSHGPVVPAVSVGEQVGRGDLLGRLDEASTLHWGARIEGTYVDPLHLLTRWRPTLRTRVPAGGLSARGERLSSRGGPVRRAAGRALRPPQGPRSVIAGPAVPGPAG